MKVSAKLKGLFACSIVLCVVIAGTATFSSGAMHHSKGQSIYLSVIPQVKNDSRTKFSYLGYLMVVRNTDIRESVTIQSITYHNAGGGIEKTILSKPLTLAPLSSRSLGFEKKELALPEGMSGCMIIKWEAKNQASPLLVEGIVIAAGTGYASGIVFNGVVIEEKE